jgi:hypothetical protein
MSSIKGKWSCAVSSTSSTSNIVFIKPSGDYAANFIEDETVSRFKPPTGRKKARSKIKKS